MFIFLCRIIGLVDEFMMEIVIWLLVFVNIFVGMMLYFLMNLIFGFIIFNFL